MSAVEVLGGQRVLVVGDDDPLVDGRSFRDLVMEALTVDAGLLVVPAARLDPAFFDLTSGVAGDVLQVSTVYGVPVAVVGAIPEPGASSDAFAALVTESNAGTWHWFVPDMAALRGRLATP